MDSVSTPYGVGVAIYKSWYHCTAIGRYHIFKHVTAVLGIDLIIVAETTK